MRRSKDEKAKTRRNIVAAAANEFRKRGLQFGVSDLMSVAGLTHGGFYRHFESKDELVKDACYSTLQSATEDLRADIKKHQDVLPLQYVITKYLSPFHRDNPGSGCVIAALGCEIVRSDRKVRKVVADGIQDMVDLIAPLLHERRYDDAQKKARLIVSAMTGALLISRIVPDKAASNDILQTTATELIANYC
jgi:TetR/AcrR family transcriptional regulator, transcriptional repressor for nem operon